MTDRHAGYVVTLERDVREDDAEPIIAAIKMLRGVLSVKPIEGGIEQSIADDRARMELGRKILDIVYPERTKR